MEFEVENNCPIPEGSPWYPTRPERNTTWPFIYMRPNQSFAIVDLHTAKIVHSRMMQYMERHPEKSFAIYEIVSGEIFRCYRTR